MLGSFCAFVRLKPPNHLPSSDHLGRSRIANGDAAGSRLQDQTSERVGNQPHKRVIIQRRELTRRHAAARCETLVFSTSDRYRSFPREVSRHAGKRSSSGQAARFTEASGFVPFEWHSRSRTTRTVHVFDHDCLRHRSPTSPDPSRDPSLANHGTCPNAQRSGFFDDSNTTTPSFVEIVARLLSPMTSIAAKKVLYHH